MGDVLNQPVVSTGEEVVLQWWQDLYHQDGQQIAYAAATALQIPQQVVSHQQSHRHHQAEVPPQVEVVFHLRGYYPMLILPTMIQQFHFIFSQNSLPIQFPLSFPLVIEQLSNKEALVDSTHSDANFYRQQGIPHWNYSCEDEGAGPVCSQAQHARNEVFRAILTAEDQAQEDQVEDQRPHHLADHSHS